MCLLSLRLKNVGFDLHNKCERKPADLNLVYDLLDKSRFSCV